MNLQNTVQTCFISRRLCASQSEQIPDPTSNTDDLELEYKPEIDYVLKTAEEKKKRKQALVGIVTSTKCLKSITVQVYHETLISKYQKVVTRRRKVMAHDENKLCNEGDLVRIVPCRPMSKKKRHVIMDIIRKAQRLEA